MHIVIRPVFNGRLSFALVGSVSHIPIPWPFAYADNSIAWSCLSSADRCRGNVAGRRHAIEAGLGEIGENSNGSNDSGGGIKEE